MSHLCSSLTSTSQGSSGHITPILWIPYQGSGYHYHTYFMHEEMEVEGLMSFAKRYTGVTGSFTPGSLTTEPLVFAGTPSVCSQKH